MYIIWSTWVVSTYNIRIYLCIHRNRLHLTRGLVKHGLASVISSFIKSVVTKASLSDHKKITDRCTQISKLHTQDLSKTTIEKSLNSEWVRTGNSLIGLRFCSYGCWPQPPSTHLLNYQIPLNHNRNAIDPLCGFLTEHNNLQLFQFRINLSYTRPANPRMMMKFRSTIYSCRVTKGLVTYYDD